MSCSSLPTPGDTLLAVEIKLAVSSPYTLTQPNRRRPRKSTGREILSPNGFGLEEGQEKKHKKSERPDGVTQRRVAARG
jgi:hypothetical protein